VESYVLLVMLNVVLCRALEKMNGHWPKKGGGFSKSEN
jgi:hypothetical protein